jgi:hypothetical protein
VGFRPLTRSVKCDISGYGFEGRGKLHDPNTSKGLSLPHPLLVPNSNSTIALWLSMFSAGGRFVVKFLLESGEWRVLSFV